jgi:AcrR family transcriptional regulator
MKKSKNDKTEILSAKDLSPQDPEMKNQIVAIALNLFNQWGIKSVSVSDLAHEMRIGKKTFYQYFSGKEELVELIVTKKIEEKKNNLLEYKLHAGNPIEVAFLGWATVRHFLKQVNGKLFSQVKKIYPNIFKLVRVFQYDFLYSHFKSNIESGITEGLYRNNIKADVISRYLLGGILSPSVENIFWKEELTSVEIENQVLSYHLHAITTEKGVKLLRQYKNEFVYGLSL